jgi:hypothetical protein
LSAVGLACEILPLPPGETRDLNNECDFVYAEVVLGEPAIDARRLLAADGVLRSTDPYLNLALRRLDQATTWPEARERLKELHRRVYADVSLIPLWQLTEHYVRRADFVGPQAAAVTLYENINAWRATGAAPAAGVSAK